ncbi:MAG: NAD(P)H-hydrate dehydratase [Thermoplasmatales archaeon]|nr:MAG: NAD(P)H-hydrate dehydratase [Thermoplasmatales archaeon]
MISGKEIKILDKNSEFFGVTNYKLMENAGKGVADFVIKRLKPTNEQIFVFCGIGNNGGDGFVTARYLAEKYKVSVFLTGKEKDIKTSISKKNFAKLKKTKIEIYDISSLKKLDKLISEKHVIIDSMLGIGLSGNLKEPYSTIVKKINSTKNKVVVSIDIPTGLGTDIAIKPEHTITFHDTKDGMNIKNSGKIEILNIGIPKKAVEYVGPGELSIYYPKPKKTSRKGDNGRILIVGGGPYIGAPAIAGFGAFRTGADLVYIATPKRVAKAITSFSPLIIKPKRLAKEVARFSPNLIVKELNHKDILIPEDVRIIDDFIPKIDTLIIGPGLGSEQKTKQSIEKILTSVIKHKKSVLIDADAIEVVGEKPKIIQNARAVITPHAGEFKKITGIKLSDDFYERKKKVEMWAKKLDTTILLKGPTDIISNGVKTKFNDVHNPAMTVGGTGDVLAGITGALLSKDVDPFNAASIGTFINGSAGNFAFKKWSYGLIATDVIEEIPNVLKKYL